MPYRSVSLRLTRVSSHAIRSAPARISSARTEMSPYARVGGRVDVVASSIGDARSLQGGTLLPTPLRGSNGDLVALAQGPLSIGGFGAGSGGNAVVVNHLTVGRIPQGAIVQTVPPVALPTTGTITFALRDPDFTTASAMPLIKSSLTLQANLFHEFHPIGGVSARLAEGEVFSWANKLVLISKVPAIAAQRCLVFMHTFYQKCLAIGREVS